MSPPIAWQGEVQLLQWSESSTRGRTVTFLLDEESDSHPFRDYATRSGKRAGHRFACVLVEIGGDEEPVEASRPSQDAAVLCKDSRFWLWLSEQSIDAVKSEAEAAAVLREMCGVSSRSELDRSPAAADRFRGLKARFRLWDQHEVL